MNRLNRQAIARGKKKVNTKRLRHSSKIPPTLQATAHHESRGLGATSHMPESAEPTAESAQTVIAIETGSFKHTILDALLHKAGEPSIALG